MEAQAEMPRYKSHKTVWALKIALVAYNDNGDYALKFEDTDFRPLIVKKYDDLHKRIPESAIEANGDPGYYVQYKDGYESWSPTKAFEEGYTREAS